MYIGRNLTINLIQLHHENPTAIPCNSDIEVNIIVYRPSCINVFTTQTVTLDDSFCREMLEVFIAFDLGKFQQKIS